MNKSIIQEIREYLYCELEMNEMNGTEDPFYWGYREALENLNEFLCNYEGKKETDALEGKPRC